MDGQIGAIQYFYELYMQLRRIAMPYTHTWTKGKVKGTGIKFSRKGASVVYKVGIVLHHACIYIQISEQTGGQTRGTTQSFTT